MSYQEYLNKNIDRYQELKNQYDEIITSDKYQSIISTMPFDFLKARYIIEMLSLFKETDGKMSFTFTSGEEAITTFKSIINFKNISENILDSASFMAEFIEVCENINKLVDESPYLLDSLKVDISPRISRMTKDCLVQIPEYTSLKTKKFRLGFIESCIGCLSAGELNKVLMEGIIKGNDLDKISLTGSPHYEENIRYLCEITGHAQLVTKNYNLNLRGTSFKDDKGIDRQKYLADLKHQMNNGIIPHLRAEIYTYYPEENCHGEPAIRILNNNNVIGHIARDIAIGIVEEYENPQFKVILKSITGGDKVNYGCNIDLQLLAPKFKEKQEDALEK